MINAKVHWLVENDPFEEYVEPLLEEIKKQGHSLQTIKYEPFKSKDYRNLYPEDSCVVFYGSINLAMQLQRQTPWVPGPIANFRNYNCSTYYAYLGKYLLNSEYAMMPYSELCRKHYDIGRQFGSALDEQPRLFIRPDDGCKPFGGHVVDNKDFERLNGPVGHSVRPEALVVASFPKTLHYEWRIVICDGKAISGCQYKYRDKLVLDRKVPDAVWEKANEIAANEWQPDRMYILDIADWNPEERTITGGYGTMYLVEINSFACSGFYCCDTEPIVREASRVALEEWEDIFEAI